MSIAASARQQWLWLRFEQRMPVASQEGLEPPTPNLEGSCSIQMSYWLRMAA